MTSLLRKSCEWIQTEPVTRQTLRLTALLLIFFPIDPPLNLMRILGGILLFVPPLLTKPWIWMLICAEAVRVLFTHWFILNNHEFLITYWCFACLIAARVPGDDTVLGANGRWLVGISFLFAELWKFLNGEFLNGAFLHFFMIHDARFAPFASLLSGIDLTLLAENRQISDALKLAAAPGLGLHLHTNEILHWLSLIFSYWTLAIEGLLAWSFLSTVPRSLHRARHVFLIIFVITTYAVVPLHRFALILTIMGFSQTGGRPGFRLSYGILFFLILLFH